MSTTVNESSKVSVDPELIARAQRGDADAFAALFEAHKGRIYSLCVRMTNDTDEAEALTQNIFVHVFRKLSTYRGECEFSSWLYPVAVNAMMIQLRAKCNRDVAFESVPHTTTEATAVLRRATTDERSVPVAAVLTMGVCNSDSTNAPSTFGNSPVAMLDVLGEPVLHRIIQGLRRSKVESIFLLVDRNIAKSAVIRKLNRDEVNVIVTSDGDFCAATQAALANCKERGLRAALVMRAATYLEFNVAEMFRFHCAAHQPITFAADRTGRFETAMIDCAASETGTAFLTSGVMHAPGSRDFMLESYANRLRTHADLRQMIEDAFSQRCKIRPRGVEVRPGVWVAESARLHPLARVESPAYIGAHTRVRAGVVVTQSSSIERNCEVDRGCTLHNATILAGTYVGVGLEIAHSVAHKNRLIDLKRSIDVELDDAGFLGSSSLPIRATVNSMAQSISMAFSPATWRPVLDHLENLLPGARPMPVPATSKVSYGRSSWAAFEELPTVINSERF